MLESSLLYSRWRLGMGSRMEECSEMLQWFQLSEFSLGRGVRLKIQSTFILILGSSFIFYYQTLINAIFKSGVHAFSEMADLQPVDNRAGRAGVIFHKTEPSPLLAIAHFLLMRKGGDLKMVLQRAQEGYAYEVMALEIEIELSAGEQCNIESISRLLQLYMMGVEMLESKSDARYKYFNAKIQSLVKRRIILEEMQRATQKLVKNELLEQARKVELGEKKQDYNLQMYLNKDQVTSKRIREFVDTAETKIKKLETRVQGAMISQDKDLEERIKRRKMRSEAGSVEKFKVMKGQVIERNIAGEKLEGFFEPWEVKEVKLAKRQPRSDEKESNAKAAIHQKLMGLM